MASNKDSAQDEASVKEISPRERAQQFWQSAERRRGRVIRCIANLKQETNKVDKEQLEQLETDLAEFRLGFVYTLSQDYTYVFEQGIEDSVWKLHSWINTLFRQLVQTNFKGHDHAVTRRKLEKAWNSFLKTAAAFYRTYFERLQVVHGMPQIPRVNRALNLAGPQAAPAQKDQLLTKAIEKSFHSTLIHLGDISRWKAQIHSTSGGSSTAVLYYQLAQDLNPTSGLAHHQLGIMEDTNHLQVVYHFYRAIAVENPHPMALGNLEQEFKKLSNLSQPRRTSPSDPNSAFADWFSKLQAYLYNGKKYPQELEDEVLGRLESALKKPDALSLVLKMVLTNIAAYYIAKSKIQQKWSLEASSSCQFILRLNVRWVVVFCRLLQTELQEFAKAAAPAIDQPEGENSDRAQSPARSKIFMDTILPLTRIYIAWLYIYRTDFVDYQDHLGPYVFEMYKVLASSLTMMTNEFNSDILGPSPYLLVEDFEALGMKPFDDATTMAPVCSLHHDGNKTSFKRHWEDCNRPRNSEQEMLSRVHDCIHFGFALALNARFPLSLSMAPDKAISVVYLEGGKPPVPTPVTADLGQVPEQLEQLDTALSHPIQQTGIPQNDGPGDDPILPSPSLPLGRSGRESPTINDLLEDEPNSGLKARMRSMVDDLLDGENSDITPQAYPRARGPRNMVADMNSSPQVSAPPFSPLCSAQGGNELYERSRAQNGLGSGQPSPDVSGSGSGPTAHMRQRFGGSMDSSYNGAAPRVDGHGRVASGAKQSAARVDSVSPPIFGFNSSWTRAFDPNASSLPPVNSPWGLPAAHAGAQPRAQPNGDYAGYQNYTVQPRTASNGRTHNGATVYGRGGPTPTDDPMYSRNAVQGRSVAAAVRDADAYDPSILLSALSPKR